MGDERKEFEWQNLGDVNFFDYGGIMVRRTERSDEFEFFMLQISAEGDKYAYNGIVTYLEDHEADFAGIAEEFGYDSAAAIMKEAPELCVRELLETFGYGPLEFNARNCRGTGEYSLDTNDFKLNDEELCNFMRSVDIPEEFIPELEYEAVSRYGDRGVKASLKSNSWEEIQAFAHEELMSGAPTEIIDHNDGSRVLIDPDEYAIHFNGDFPIDPAYPLELNYRDDSEEVL